MKLKAILLLSCVWCVAARELPMTANAVAAGPQQYVGVVDGTNVYVRYNASVNAYPCTKLSRPQRVTVTGSTDGWLEILPPPGVFSAVAKDYVKPDAGGKFGVVTANRVWIRAGGDLRETNFTGREIQLNSGDKVVIIGQATYDVLGETKQYYKIVPPKDVRFWISDRYVKPLETASASPVGPPAPSAKEGPPATQPSAPTATTLPVVETRSSEKELTTALDKFRAVEKELIRQFAKPPAARDYQRLIGRFQALKAPPGSHLQPYIDYYIDYLKFAIKKDADRKKFQALVKNAAASQAEYDIRRTEIETAPPTTSPVAYTGQGVLEASAIYTGTPGSPKRFLLRDEQTGIINAYVEPIAGLKIDKYVGKKVGLLGKSHFDSEIMTEIIKADHVVVLEDRPVLPKLPEAVIAPLPPLPAPAIVAPAKPTPPAVKPVLKLAPKPSAAKPSPKPTVKPSPKPSPAPKPVAPAMVKPSAAPKPKPRPKPAPAVPTVKPSPRPVLKPPAATLSPKPVAPAVKPPAAPKPKPTISPKPAPKPNPKKPKKSKKPRPTLKWDLPAVAKPLRPAARSPATRPAAKVVLPVVRLRPTTRPTTRPVTTKPLPPSGLPIVKPVTPNAIDEEEYD